MERDRYGYVEFIEMQSVPVLFNEKPSFSELVASVAEPPNLMSHRSACLPSDTKHSRKNTKLLGSVGHTPGENPKIHIFPIRITNERIKLTIF